MTLPTMWNTHAKRRAQARKPLLRELPTELQSLQKNAQIKLHSGNGVVIRYLVLNVKRAPTNRLPVRKALAYLIPRQTIAAHPEQPN